MNADEIIFTAQGELQRYGVVRGAWRMVRMRGSKSAPMRSILFTKQMRGTRTCPPGAIPFRLGLHAGDGVKHAHRAVQNAQSSAPLPR